MALAIRTYLLGASILIFPLAAIAAEKPKLPYIDQGACPFGCCTYREWNTTQAIEVRNKPSRTAEHVFDIPSGETVGALTGMVITTKTGVTRIRQPTEIGYDKEGHGPLLSLKAGERVYTLRYQGEAYDLFWYRGKIYSDQISVENSTAVKIESRPQAEWWAQIRDGQGRTGWVEVTENFEHMDACE